MSKNRVIKFISFGAPLEERNKTYTCLKDWPENVSIQCGDKGVVLRKSGGYSTAFFEVFSKEDFIRGEGEDLISAEEKAFDKLEKILNCSHPNYEREGSQNRDVCKTCGHKEKKYYPPSESCSQCGKIHAGLKINKEALCLDHYIEKASNMDLNITPEKILTIKKNVFKDIMKTKNKEDKNLIELVMDKEIENYKKPEDIPDDNYRVEMKIDELIDIKKNLKILKVLKNMNINEKFKEEHLFLEFFKEINDRKGINVYKKSLDAIKEIIEDLFKNNKISVKRNKKEDIVSMFVYDYIQSHDDQILKLSDFIDILQIDTKLSAVYPEKEHIFASKYFNNTIPAEFEIVKLEIKENIKNYAKIYDDEKTYKFRMFK